MRISDWSSDVCSSDLQEATGGRSQANLHFSMSQRQAFGPHCDVHEVFAVHCNGEKVWNLYENREAAPVNHPSFQFGRSEERRVGKECVRTCKSRWSPFH